MKVGLINRFILLKSAKPYNKAATRKLDKDDSFEIIRKCNV